MNQEQQGIAKRSLFALIVSYAQVEELIALDIVECDLREYAATTIYRRLVQPRSHVIVYLPQFPNDIQAGTGAQGVKTKGFADLLLSLSYQLFDACTSISQPITMLRFVNCIDPVYNGVSTAGVSHGNRERLLHSYSHSSRQAEFDELLNKIVDVEAWSHLMQEIFSYAHTTLRELSVYDRTASCVERDNQPLAKYLKFEDQIISHGCDSLEYLCMPCCNYTDPLLDFLCANSETEKGSSTPQLSTLNLFQCQSRGICILHARSLDALMTDEARNSFQTIKHLVCIGSFDDADVLQIILHASMWRNRLRGLFPNVETVDMNTLYPDNIGNEEGLDEFIGQDVHDDDEDFAGWANQAVDAVDDEGTKLLTKIRFRFRTVFFDCSPSKVRRLSYLLRYFGRNCTGQLILSFTPQVCIERLLNCDFIAQLHDFYCSNRDRMPKTRAIDYPDNNQAVGMNSQQRMPRLIGFYRQMPRRLVTMGQAPQSALRRVGPSSSSIAQRPVPAPVASSSSTLLTSDVNLMFQTFARAFDKDAAICREHRHRSQCNAHFYILHYAADWTDTHDLQWSDGALSPYANKLVRQAFVATCEALARGPLPSSTTTEGSSSTSTQTVMPHVLCQLKRLVVRFRFREGMMPDVGSVLNPALTSDMVMTVARLMLRWPSLRDVELCLYVEPPASMSNWTWSMLGHSQRQNRRNPNANRIRFYPLITALRALHAFGDGSNGNFNSHYFDGDEEGDVSQPTIADSEAADRITAGFVKLAERNIGWLSCLCKRSGNKDDGLDADAL